MMLSKTFDAACVSISSVAAITALVVCDPLLFATGVAGALLSLSAYNNADKSPSQAEKAPSP